MNKNDFFNRRILSAMPSEKVFSVELFIRAWNGTQSTQFPLTQQHDPAELLDLFLMHYRMYLRY